MAKPEPFANSMEHILAEMKRIDLMLRRAVLVTRRSKSDEVSDEFRGLVISDENVDRMLDSVDFLGDIWKLDKEVRPLAERIDLELQLLQNQIRARMEASARAGRTLTLFRLAEVCGLSPAEVDLLLIGLAPELEPRYETLYSYLHNDVTRKRPSVDLALNLICRTEHEKMGARELLYPEAPLLYFRLVELQDEMYDRKPTLLRRFLKIEESAGRFLLSGQTAQAAAVNEVIVPQESIERMETSEKTRTELRNLVRSLAEQGSDNAVIQLWGGSEAPLMQAAEAVATALHKNISYIDLSSLQSEKERAAVIVRDALLWDNLLVLDRSRPETTAPEQQKAGRPEAEAWKYVAATSIPVVILNTDEHFGECLRSGSLWRLEVELPAFETRKQHWLAALENVISDQDAERLADLFMFNRSRIEQTASLARAFAVCRDPAQPRPLMADVLAAARDLTTPNLQRLAVMVDPKYGWDDLVLPEDRMRQLRAVAARLRYRSVVYRDWGFGEKLSRGRGLCVLFSGPSGTGKTMAAEVLARDLSLRLFQIDLSAVVSKYIGETEQHLSMIFREAELSQSLLFFDEADALFSKRTEVKDAHDRYANIEVNFLLQRVEQYRGLVVLATNFQKNLDEAFLRRLQYVVEFPLPDDRARARIWTLQFPEKKAPLGSDIDFDFLGTQFQLSGASIRSVALEAAFLAAEEGGAQGEIGIKHIIEAIRHEHQKQGKLVMTTDLGPYARVS